MASQHQKPGIVVVEDEPDIADLLALYFRQDGWDVHLVASGAEAIEVIHQRQPQFVILDINLTAAAVEGDSIDGLEVCRQIRASRQATIANLPVLFLTARDAEIDRILGLEMGGDDYVTKPFSPREIVARVKAIMRRGDHSPTDTSVTVFGSITIDRSRREVTSSQGDGSPEPVTLATQEFALLDYLLDNQGIALNRDQILKGGWGEDWYGDPRTVDVHIRQLRRKLGDDLPLATVRGVGYRLG